MKPSVANRLQKRLREQDDKRKGRKEELKRKVQGLRRKYRSRSPPRSDSSDSDVEPIRRYDSLDRYRGKRRKDSDSSDRSPVNRKRRERSESSGSGDSDRTPVKRKRRERSESSESDSERGKSEERKRRERSESPEKSDSERVKTDERKPKGKDKRRERSESPDKSDSEREKAEERKRRERSESPEKSDSEEREAEREREKEREKGKARKEKPREDTETRTARMEWDQIQEEERMEEERLERERRERNRAGVALPKPVDKAPFVISGGESKSFGIQEEPYEVQENEREQEREKDREREREKEKETERELEKEKERERELEKENERERERVVVEEPQEERKEDRREEHEEPENHERERENENHERERENEEKSKEVGRDFDESVLRSKFQYAYEDDRESIPSEQYNSKRIEQFILDKGFMILEYFVVHDLCSFVLVQMPAIGETMMVYVNRQKYPINVSGSAYPKTDLERLKLDKTDGDTNDYENISMKGFDVAHSPDRISDTNGRQKSLAYYVQRQVQRMMYVTQHIDIKPCILLNGIFGFYDTYQIVRRPVSSEFYPVISLEILFSKTFLLEQNIPVFYSKLYSIMNQSNRNKMEYLLSSLRSLGDRIERFKREDAERDEKERDKGRIKVLLAKLGQKQVGIEAERAKMRGEDRIAESYATRRLNDEWAQWEEKRVECNSLYGQIKREYDKDVFMNEVFFHELYYKIRDMEQMIEYLN